MSRNRHGPVSALLALATVLGCAGRTPRPAAEPLHLSEIEAPGDPVRRASLRLCVAGLDAETDGRGAAALGRYERAIQVDPTNPYAYLALARYEVDEGDPERALQYLDQAKSLLAAEDVLSPGAEAHVAGLRGLALIAAGRDGRAQLHEAQRLAPEAWEDGRLDPDELR